MRTPSKVKRQTESYSASYPAKVVISVDVEDWAQSTWDHSLEVTEIAKRNTERLLDLLSKHEKKATMFILGKFAERFPGTARRISKEGHEIASHGHGHIQVFAQAPEEFRQDVTRAKYFLEDLLGQSITGYRAPDFSIVTGTTWALDILAEVGFRYDSSIFPIKNRRYGIEGWPTRPATVALPSGRSIVELPMATIPVFGTRRPVAGGGYHRLLPWPLIRLSISRSLRAGEPFMSYCHPYEFDPKEFENSGLDVPLFTRLHQGLGRKGFQAKFERVLMSFETVEASNIAFGHPWPDYAL